MTTASAPTRAGRARRRVDAVRFVPIVAALLSAACAAPPAAPPQALKVDGLWRIDQAMIEPLLDRREARLDFGANGRLTGHTGCNTLRSDYQLTGDGLRIGVVLSTRSVCSEALMDQEDRVLTALEKAVSARVRPDGLLELRDADGRGVLRGTRFVP